MSSTASTTRSGAAFRPMTPFPTSITTSISPPSVQITPGQPARSIPAPARTPHNTWQPLACTPEQAPSHNGSIRCDEKKRVHLDLLQSRSTTPTPCPSPAAEVTAVPTAAAALPATSSSPPPPSMDTDMDTSMPTSSFSYPSTTTPPLRHSIPRWASQTPFQQLNCTPNGETGQGSWERSDCDRLHRD